MPRLQAALLGGLFIGVLSSLPVVNIANCCCLWVIVGGVLTVYLQQQGRTTAIAPADAALSGLFAGLVGALISLALTAVFFSMTGGMATQFREMAEQYPQMPAETRDMIIRLSEGSGMFLLVSLFTIPIYAIVSMLGGLLGTLIFRKPAPPPTPPPPAQV